MGTCRAGAAAQGRREILGTAEPLGAAGGSTESEEKEESRPVPNRGGFAFKALQPCSGKRWQTSSHCPPRRYNRLTLTLVQIIGRIINTKNIQIGDAASFPPRCPGWDRLLRPRAADPQLLEIRAPSKAGHMSPASRLAHSAGPRSRPGRAQLSPNDSKKDGVRPASRLLSASPHISNLTSQSFNVYIELIQGFSSFRLHGH